MKSKEETKAYCLEMASHDISKIENLMEQIKEVLKGHDDDQKKSLCIMMVVLDDFIEKELTRRTNLIEEQIFGEASLTIVNSELQ